MPFQYEWLKLSTQADAERTVTPRAGHTLTPTNAGFVMHGGMDGRRNDQGNPAPNSDVFILKLGQQRTYEWQAIELDAASQIPPARTLHSALATSGDEIFIFGGIHSAMPYQCLQDGWIIDTTCMEWKKIHFKAQVAGKGTCMRRMSGLIQDRKTDGPSRRKNSSGRRNSHRAGSFRDKMSSGRGTVSFESLAGAATRAVHDKRSNARGTMGSSKKWKGALQKKMGAMLQASKPGSNAANMKMKKPGAAGGGGGGQAAATNLMTTNEEQFHEELIAMVSQTCADDADSHGVVMPAQRSNHTSAFIENTVVLFGGHGGVGYQRRAFNDAWVLNLDNARWHELTCQGNPPAPRSGHVSFAKETDMFVFGGWNNETQFNDLFMLDIENKDWSDVDLSWGVPRWNCAIQLVEAIPSWRVFVFGGSADTLGEGRGGGMFDSTVGVLNLAAEYEWDEPKLEGDLSVKCPPREHAAMCYEPEESRLIVFGGWANKWLDDVWQINVSSIVGPPYAILKVEPPLGPVTGNMKITVHGVGFASVNGMCTVQFATPKQVATCQGNVVSDEIIECFTPAVTNTIGPKDCEVRVQIGIKDLTTTVTGYNFFLNTLAEKSLCFGPGVLPEQQANKETRFIIQARNTQGENRQSGRDDFIISVQQIIPGEDGKKTFQDLPFEFVDLNTGQYEVKYLADEGDVKIDVFFVDETGTKKKVRGSPYKPSFSNSARNRANEYAGPLITSWIGSTMKSLEEFHSSTNTGHSTKLKDGDVKGLIKVMNHIQDMYDQEDDLILRQDELFEMLYHLDKKEGLPSDKQMKQLKKIGANITQLKTDIEAKEKDIAPMRQKESDLYRKKIVEFEEELKTYQSGLKKEGYYFYKSGLELATDRIHGVTADLDKRDNEMSELQHIADNFKYSQELNNSKKVMAAMRDDVLHAKQLWEFETFRIQLSERFLVQKWGTIVAGDMEDEIKSAFKKLKDIKVDRKCDAFQGMQDIMKKWTTFCPLVGELLDKAMRTRHWTQLMGLCGKNITVTPDVLLRDMWNLELHKFPDACEDTADQAKQEAKMEVTIAKISKEWAEIDFEFAPHKNSDVQLMKISDDKFELLEEHQVQVQNMFASRFLATFEKEVVGWQKVLANVAEVSTLISEVQRSWAFLENLFIFSDEVKKELPEESDKFIGIDMEVKEILKQGFEVQSAKDFCNQGNIFQKLEKAMAELTMCEKALNEFMDGKRRSFPRFYFMSSADLLDVLSNGNNPAKVVPQFPKFFIAIDHYKLEFPDGEKARPSAVGMEACVGKEFVSFPEPLPLLGKVEVYLDKCIEGMRKALKYFAKEALQEYTDTNCAADGELRAEFIGKCQAAQCALLAQLIEWVKLVEQGFDEGQAGDAEAVSKKWQQQAQLLLKLIDKTVTNLDKPTRQKVMCAITLDAHNRDVQEKLVKEKVVSREEFQWQSMLKCYWITEEDDAEMHICDAKFWYGYEYLGNGPRLVVTPLTDRIYVTATQALHLCMGCAPAGPAGTGKTESTKDLANAVAKACYVINAAPEMDYLTMGNIYKGLSASGSWGCFDEFNRLIPEVLSVCTVQFKSVCDAVKAKAKRFILQGDEMTLDLQVGCYITMNPGYLGRSELPEGLKALFRPITVMVPDFKLIMENMFMGEGFTEAKALGLKFATLYALNKDLLSQSKKYDWGMRAIKSVLVVAGGFKRADATLTEQAVLMRSLRDTNVAKIEGDDLKIFMGLLLDLFPGISVPRARDHPFEEILVSVMQEDYGYTHDPDGYLLLKITQLIELLAIRHCVFLMGNPGSFKSSMWKVLKNAKTRNGEKTTVVDFSPKAISTNELYGFVNMQTREWKDGILSKTMRDLGLVPDTLPKWILLDGDLDANWIESMNSVMDDNRLLTLPSNERITLKAHMKMIFEIRDLNYATPATATRAGIVCMDDTFGVQWRSYVTSWIRKQEHPDPIKEQLQKLFDKYGPDTLFWMLKNTKMLVPMVDIAMVSVVCSFLDNLLTPNCFEALEYWFVSCFTFGVGMILAEVDGIDYRKQFSNWWKGEMKTIKYPSKGTVFDYYVNENRLDEWTSMVETLEYSSDTPMGEVTVPTTETVAMTYFMKALIVQHHPIMCIGLAGCGKTQTSLGCLKSLDPEYYTFYLMNMSYYTDSTLLQAMMENPLEKKAGKLYGPPGKLQMVYFIDDLNMPMLDKYNTQSAIELMKQKQDYGHWYDRAKITIKDIGSTQYLSCMNPTAGSFIVNPRLQRHFWTISVPFPEQAALHTIYQTFMKGHFERLGFKSAVNDAVSGVIKTALSLHSMVVSSFRKTAANFHYEFNIRHMSGVFGGLLQASPTEFVDAEKVVLLWIHESERVYGDRLVSVADLKKYRGLAAELSKKMFSKFNFQKYFQEKNPEPLVFAPFSKGISEMEGGGTYDKIPGAEKLSSLLDVALKEYNENMMAMDLVLFMDAMSHVSKICRIVTNPSGHPLLVGVGGSGRQSLSRLASYTCGFITSMIVISGHYGMSDLKTDLQAMYTKAGVKDEGVMFLFTDNQITHERFLVYINDLLASGDIADLYASDEKDAIRNAVRGGCKGAGIVDTPDNLWSFFISRIRKNLHMSLCFSPVGDAMRARARKFPALVNCTVIDWFQPWPMDALYNVGVSRLGPIEQLGPADSPVRAGICEFMPYSFESSGKEALLFMETERRFAYATPKSYLELINLYTSMVGKKVDQLEEKKERLSNGLEKLRSTETEVAGLEEELKEKAVVVKEKAEKADIFAEEVGIEKTKVEAENEKAGIEAKNCAKIAKDVTAQRISCEEDLAKAIPLVQQAEAALDVLDKKDFQELKSLPKPPGGVDLVCACAMHLQAGIDPNIAVDKKGAVQDDSWKGAQKMMNAPEKFLVNLREYKNFIDDGQVPQVNVERARKIKDSFAEGEFTQAGMSKKSNAAGGLTVWIINIIMYYDVVIQVEPKRQALREANETLEAANTKKAQCDALVADLQAKLAKLMKEFDAAMAEKDAVMKEAAKCQTKLDMAQRLVGALSANGVIWEQTIQSAGADLIVIPGDALVACSFASYVGVFTRHYREACIDQYVQFLKKHNVPLADKPDPLGVLATEAEMAGWAGQGLPADRVSMENGAIMTNSQRWPLIIDPQLQGIVWIKNKEADNQLQVTRMGHAKMVQTFEQSIDHGKSVLIENMQEKIDAVLAPVISRTTIKRGNKKVVKLGDKEIVLSPNFRLFMQTKLLNPHYPPEIQAECTIINFTVTEDGLEDQILFLVVRLERPDLAKRKTELTIQQNEFKVTLAALEALLLEKLASAEGDILEDTELILSLEDAKKTSDEVKEKAVIAQDTEAKINETSEFYRPSGNRGSLLFFLLLDLCKMHTFYRYSLDSFVSVVTRAVKSVSLIKPKEPKKEKEEKAEGDDAEEKGEEDEDEDVEEEEEEVEEEEEEEEIIELHGKELKQRVTLLEGTITYAVFSYTRRGLLDADKLTVASMMVMKMLVRSGTVMKEELDVLIRAPPDPNPPPMPENVRSFLTEVQWAQLKSLEPIPCFKASGQLTQNVEQDTLGWKRWFSEEKAEIADLPRSARDLSVFHRLFLLRILRPDRLGAALTQFIVDNCGQEYVEQPPFDMYACYEESSANTPFFFVLFPGTDPTGIVEAVANSVGCTEKNGMLMNISMGQGQETVALNALNKLATNGGWIMLQNIHLMQEWLPQLERALEVIEEFAVPEFRCVLTSEPPGVMQGRLWPLLPEAILQRCIKVSDEAPTDLKSNLRRAYSKFSQESIDECLKPKEFKATLFALCFFHALISGRIKFGAQGWSKKYPFNDGDLQICGTVLRNYLNNSEQLGTEVPWADLRYLFGEIMYGGHITDFWDRKVDNTYLAVLVTPELLNGMNLCPAYNQGFKSPDSSKMEYQGYTKYIEDRFPMEQPQMYGLHPNAEIGFLTNQGISIFRTIQEISGGGGGGGGGDIGASQVMITSYMGQLPENLDMLDIRGRLKEEDYTPYIIVSLQESEAMNKLLSGMRGSMTALELGISGALNVTESMEELAVDLMINKVNSGWSALAFPSLKLLASWFGDLLLRVDQLNRWTGILALLPSLWLSGLFNAMSFMTAVMQTTARAQQLPLDYMTNRCKFTNTRDLAEITAQPAEGVYIHGLFMKALAGRMERATMRVISRTAR
jgi:dynein heavy chain